MKNHTRVYEAIKNPSRAAEVRAWVHRHPEDAFKFIGRNSQESLMHWAAISDLGLVVDLLALSFPVNPLDSFGRTPFDWAMDRLWCACASPNSPLNESGKVELLKHSEDLIGLLLQYDAKPGILSAPAPFFGTILLLSGSIHLLKQVFGENIETIWFEKLKKSPLHDWILTPLGSVNKKREILDWLFSQEISVDSIDGNGRSALWYAVDAWLSQVKPEYSLILKDSIQILLKKGADPFLVDKNKISPEILFKLYSEKKDVSKEILEWEQMLALSEVPIEIITD